MHLLAALIVAVTPGIRTPTGNITCFVSHGTLHCQIAQSAYRRQLQQQCTAKVSLDWVGFEVGPAERARPTCSGGALFDTPPKFQTLAYGRVWSIDAITCTSRVTALTCTARGHGIVISRQSWRGW